jgi:hypothetical protein
LVKYLRASVGDLLKQCTKTTDLAIFCFSVIQMQKLLISLQGGDAKSRKELQAVLADDPWRAAVEFDTELFAAYAEDWRARVVLFGSLSKKAEFVSRYEKLMVSRDNYQKAKVRYDRTMFHFNGVVAQHREANSLLAQLKERFCEVALSEVSEEVEFTS